MNNNKKSLLTKKEAAELLNIHTNTLDRWVSQNLVKAVKIATWSNGKRVLRFRVIDLENIGSDTQPEYHVRKRKGA